jgi:EAL domain-containing protein (putative c-di-GMP-specific phosphodiesterase class I)
MTIQPLPFRVGRRAGLELVLPSQLVSKLHAEIYSEAGVLRLRDLNSTNGTFVNRNRIQDVAIADGDVLHFADFEFRLGREERSGVSAPAQPGHSTLAFGDRPLPQHFAVGTRELKELLAEGCVGIVFQPIVRLPGGEVAGYEALGRGQHPRLPASPAVLFQIAESAGLACELSRLFRHRTLELVRERTDLPALFLNTHPTEWEQPGLVESLEEVKQLAPEVKLILEIHESVLAVPLTIQALRARLDQLGVGLAYDDFGAGQARLIELAEAPPHFLKFDRRFVADIDKAPASKQRLLAALVAAARELMVETVAEGVATTGEADVVTRMGFSHAQGFLFGRPIAQEQL